MARHHLTSVIQFSARAGALAAMLIGAAPHAFAACQSPAAFGGWLQGFKKSAVAQGISPGVVSEALDGLTYDPATIAKGPTYNRFDVPGGDVSRVYADAEGIGDVFVNGVQIVRDGEHTGKLPGTVLRSGKDTETVTIDAMRANKSQMEGAL